jgi:hypothetical protein
MVIDRSNGVFVMLRVLKGGRSVGIVHLRTKGHGVKLRVLNGT